MAVDYADFVITEITCHGRGGREMAGNDCAIIDVGGQDTKVILVKQGMIQDFLMNDKCSAGTGKFLEIMANRLGVTIAELFDLAAKGTAVPISSLCTVAEKVAQLARRKQLPGTVILTGGLSECPYFAEILSENLGCMVEAMKDGRYAGAFGASLLAKEKKK